MKFTPTSYFNAVANGASKVIVRRVYVRKTSDLTLALSDSTGWIEVTNKVLTFPAFQSQVEIDIGKPTTQSCQFEFFGIAWWKANIFNASATEYIEIKVEGQIGVSESKLATDIVYQFSGYLDKDYTPNNNTDTVTVNALSLDDLLALMAGENLVCQILDASGNLRLPTLTGITVSNANIMYYRLIKGVHTISLDITDAMPPVMSAKLDDGDWVLLSSGTVVLTNNYLNPITGLSSITQKVEVQCDLSKLPTVSSTAEVIVKTTGDTLPYTWYKSIWIFQLLKKIYAQIGITNYSFDDFQLATYDSREVPSLWDVPIGDSYYNQPSAICCDNTNGNLYIGIYDRVYKHNLTTHIYTLVDSTTYPVVKLWGDDSASGYIWGVTRSTSGVHRIIRITITDSTLAEYNITRTTATIGSECNFDIDLGKRGIFYCSNDGGYNQTNIFLLNSLTEQYMSVDRALLIDLPAFSDGSGNYYHQWSSTNYCISKATWSGAAFSLTDLVSTCPVPILAGAYASVGVFVGCRNNATVGLGGGEMITATDDRTFETTKGNWADNGNHSAVRSTTYKHVGTASLRITQATGGGQGDQTTNFESLDNSNFNPMRTGKKYVLTLWAYGVTNLVTLTIAVGDQVSISNNIYNGVAGTFKKITFSFTATSGTIGKPIQLMMYNPTASPVICYVDDVSLIEIYDAWEIVRYTCSTTAPTVILTEYSQAAGFVANNITNYVYWFGSIDASLIQYGKKANASTASTGSEPLPLSYQVNNSVTSNHICRDIVNNRLVGILEPAGMLFQYGTKASMYIDTIDAIKLQGRNLQDVLNEILSSYLLVGFISAIKKAIVYRRINDAGVLVTSGSSISLTNNHVEANGSDVTEGNLYNRAVSWISVSNGIVTHTYDGSAWDIEFLGTGRQMSISKQYIPNNLIKDVAYYLFNFFQIDHTLYSLPLANILPMQMESLDGCSFVLNSKLIKTASGIIYGVAQADDGQLTFQVLV